MILDAMTPAEAQSPSTVWGGNFLFRWQSFLQTIQFTGNGNCLIQPWERPKCTNNIENVRLHTDNTLQLREYTWVSVGWTNNVRAKRQQRLFKLQHTPPGHWVPGKMSARYCILSNQRWRCFCYRKPPHKQRSKRFFIEAIWRQASEIFPRRTPRKAVPCSLRVVFHNPLPCDRSAADLSSQIAIVQ